MPNPLSLQMYAQIFGQESSDPYLTLLTINHENFDAPIYLVNNTVNIVSRGVTFEAFPFTVRLPADDGESVRDISLEFDNASLRLIDEVRSVTTPATIKVEFILASIPNVVQQSFEEIQLKSITYNKSRISAQLVLDSFLNTEMTSESYKPTNFPGLF